MRITTVPSHSLQYQYNILPKWCHRQGKKVYYHKIIVETNDNKEFVSVKCVTMALPTYNVTRHSHNIARRDVLPPGFEEPM